MSRPFTEIPSYLVGMGSEIKNALFDLAGRVKVRMSEEGKPIRYPVQWDSERQKRFVIAKLRRENNLPYARSHRYRLSWQEARTPIGATLSAPSPAGAIGGLPSGWQSRIHRGRWPNLLVVLFDELSRLPAEISNRIRVYSAK